MRVRSFYIIFVCMHTFVIARRRRIAHRSYVVHLHLCVSSFSPSLSFFFPFCYSQCPLHHRRKLRKFIRSRVYASRLSNFSEANRSKVINDIAMKCILFSLANRYEIVSRLNRLDNRLRISLVDRSHPLFVVHLSFLKTSSTER